MKYLKLIITIFISMTFPFALLAHNFANEQTLALAKALILQYQTNTITCLTKLQQPKLSKQLKSKLITQYKNSLMMPIEDTIHYQASPVPATFIITGGWQCYGPPNPQHPTQPSGTMSEMWIRDAIAQLHSYLPIFMANKSSYPKNEILALKDIMRGFINTSTDLLASAPYAHAFTPTNSPYPTRVDPAGADYELDTPAFYLWFLHEYYIATGDTTIFTSKLTNLIATLLIQFKNVQKNQVSYVNVTPETTFNDLKPKVIKKLCSTNCVGLASSYTRASDDKLQLPYNIPDNMLLWVALNDLQTLPLVDSKTSTAQSIKQQANRLKLQIRKGINFAKVDTPKYGIIYAYETDGAGQAKDNTFTGDGKTNKFLLNFIPYKGTKPFANPENAIEVKVISPHQTTVLSPEKDFKLEGQAIILNKPLQKGQQLIVRGNFIFMDDANLPSLLSMPYLGYVNKSEPTYANTRQFILSLHNPYYFQSDEYNGVGSPHIVIYTKGLMSTNVWPLAIITRGLTSTDASEQINALKMLTKSSVNANPNAFSCNSPSEIQAYPATNYLHESFDIYDPEKFTRGYFAWPNALFAEWIESLVNNKKN